MEEKDNVPPAGAVQGAEAREGSGTAAPCGKFKSVDALLHAYNSLEAEFTRRSQRLRESEGRFAAAGGEAQKDAQSPAQGGAGGQAAAAEGDVLPAAEGGAAPAGIWQRRIEEAAARAVEAYAAERARAEAPRVLAGGGAFALAPARRVRTFGEAGDLARELFNKNGNQ